MMSLSLFACRKSDYGFLSPDKQNPEEDPNNTVVETDETENAAETEGQNLEGEHEIVPDDIRTNMRFDAAIQHMGWGEQQTRCQIQVAFTRRWSEPQEPDNSPPQDPPPPPPENAGECVFHRSERPEGQGPQPDNWYVSGDLQGPLELFLHNLDRTIVLEKVTAEDGLIRYEMPDCRQETFPFGEVFDLEIPESSGAGAIPAAYIEEVLAFGPNIAIATPDELLPNQQYQGHASDGLYFSWDFEQSVPSIVEEQLSIQLINNSNQPWDYQESMRCLPDSREDLALTGDDLLQFTLSEYLGEGIFSIGLNVHGDYYGPEREDPWGNIFRTRVNVARGGMMELAE